MIHDTMLATSFDDMPCICVLGRTASGCRNTQSYRAAAGYKTPQHSPAACGHLVPPSAQAWPLSQTLPRVWQCWKPPRECGSGFLVTAESTVQPQILSQQFQPPVVEPSLLLSHWQAPSLLLSHWQAPRSGLPPPHRTAQEVGDFPPGFFDFTP
jgi:hypothetical protein